MRSGVPPADHRHRCWKNGRKAGDTRAHILKKAHHVARMFESPSFCELAVSRWLQGGPIFVKGGPIYPRIGRDKLIKGY